MVFNGEIYNYVELGDELRRAGVHLQTRSDSEVLLEAYARYGKDVMHRLRGMFAFAIWDSVSRELFCARDQFGIKPFCYVIDKLPGQPRRPPGDGVPPFGRTTVAPSQAASVARGRPARDPASAAPARLPGGAAVAPARRGPTDAALRLGTQSPG